MRFEIVRAGEYKVFEVVGDDECGFTAFGIDRREAHRLIIQALNEGNEGVIHLLSMAVKEALLTKEFYEHLVFFRYLKPDAASGQIPSHEKIIANFSEHALNPEILKAFIDYDIGEGKINMGWAHPAVLRTLAHIQEINLYIWVRDSEGNLLPHRRKDEYDFFECVHDNATERKDLLFSNGHHFELLQLACFEKRREETDRRIQGEMEPYSPTPTTIVKKDDTRIEMRDFDMGDGHRRKELYLALAKPPVDHKWGKAAAKNKYCPGVLRVGVWLGDGYFEKLSGVKASIPPIPWIALFFFLSKFMWLAEKMWGGGAGLALDSTEFLLAAGFYMLGIVIHSGFSRYYLYRRGPRFSDFPDDFLSELNRAERDITYVPRLDRKFIHPRTREEFNEFFKLYSEEIVYCIQEKDFDAVAKILKSVRTHFPYIPQYDIIQQEIELPPEPVEEKVVELTSSKKVNVARVIERPIELDPKSEMVQRIRKLQMGGLHSYLATWIKKKDMLAAREEERGANTRMMVEHYYPSPRPPRPLIDVESVAEVLPPPEKKSSPPRIVTITVERCDIYSLPLIQGGEFELSHGPHQAIKLPAYSGHSTILPDVDAPPLDANNIATLLAEFAGRVRKHAPLGRRENDTETGLYEMCCAGKCCCPKKSDELRATEQLQLIKALLQDNPYKEKAPVGQVKPAINIQRVKKEIYVAPEASKPAPKPATKPLTINDDESVPLVSGDATETTQLLPAKKPISVGAVPLQTYRFQKEFSENHRRGLEIVAILRPATGKYSVKYHRAEYFTYCDKDQFFNIFMRLTEEERSRFIYILLSSYEAAQLLALSFVSNQYVGKKSFNPKNCGSETGILQKTYDCKIFMGFVEGYIKTCKKEGAEARVMAQHLYLLTSLSSKQAVKHMRALFENNPELAAAILVILTNPQEYGSAYAAHVEQLFLGNKVSPAGQDRIWTILVKNKSDDCIARLLSFLSDEVRVLIAGGFRFAKLQQVAIAIKHKKPEVRARAYAIHAEKIAGPAHGDAVERLVSRFKRPNSLRSFCDKGKLLELRETFEKTLSEEDYHQAIARVAFALLKKERQGVNFGSAEKKQMKKAQLMIFICERLYPKTNIMDVFFSIGIQLMIDGFWEKSEQELERIFEYCIYPKRLINNKNLKMAVLVQGLIQLFKNWDDSRFGGYEETRLHQIWIDMQKTIIYGLLKWLLKNSFTKEGKDRLGLILTFKGMEFPYGVFVATFKTTCTLELSKEQKYQFLYELLEAHFKDPDYSKFPLDRRIGFCKKLLESQEGLSFTEMWLFLAKIKIQLTPDISLLSPTISKVVLANYASELPGNAAEYLMPVFCAHPAICCEAAQWPLLLELLFSPKAKINYKLYTCDFLKVITNIFNRDEYFLPGLFYENKPTEQKVLACRCASMMLYSIYDDLYMGPELLRGVQILARHKKIPKDKAITKYAGQMYQVIEKLHKVLGETGLIDDFIKNTFSDTGIFLRSFVDMGFKKRDAESVGKLLLTYYKKIIVESSMQVLQDALDDDEPWKNLGDTLDREEDDFFEQEPEAQSLMIDMEDSDLDIIVGEAGTTETPLEPGPAADEFALEQGVPQMIPVPSASSALTFFRNKVSASDAESDDEEDEAEESTSYDEEEEPSLSSSR